MAQSFDFEVSRIRLYCKDLTQLNTHLQGKISGIDKMEIENLEMHMQLDAKLRALETVLKCGTEPAQLFAVDHPPKAFSMNT